jgi:hypothetical protein
MNIWTPTPMKTWPWSMAAVFFLLALVFMGRSLDFSAYAHPDERNKIAQIVEGRYNFHHPLLMLNSVRVFTEAIGKSLDFEFVKLAGRWSSVFFTSFAVMFLVLLSGRLHGRLIGAAAGVFLLSNPHLFDLAHYFKEDPALLFGISLSLIAMLIFSERPGYGAGIFLGLATSCAFSGKYAGALVIPFSIYIVLAASKNRVPDLAAMLAAFAMGCLLINLPAFLAMGSASNSLDREIGLLTGVTKEVSRSVPHGVYSNVYWQSSTPVLVGLLALYGFGLARQRFRLRPIEWVVVLFPVVYIAMLSFLPRTNHRYFLPAAAILACLSAFGLLRVMQFKNGKWIAALLIVVSVGWQVPRLYHANAGFSQHHQSEALQFLRTQLPPDSKTMEDRRVYFPPYDDPTIVRRNVAPGDTLESLRDQGFTHIIVTSRMYGEFFKKSSKPSKEGAADFAKMRSFYETLFDQGILLKEWLMGGNQYLANPLRIYSIASPEPSASDAR